MAQIIRKLTVGASPKDDKAFHYAIGTSVAFYAENSRMNARIIKIRFLDDIFFKFGREKYEITVETPNKDDDEVMDTLLWKVVTIGERDSCFIEYDLNY